MAGKPQLTTHATITSCLLATNLCWNSSAAAAVRNTEIFAISQMLVDFQSMMQQIIQYTLDSTVPFPYGRDREHDYGTVARCVTFPGYSQRANRKSHGRLILEAANGLLTELAGTSYKVIARLQVIPAIALQVDSYVLKMLEN